MGTAVVYGRCFRSVSTAVQHGWAQGDRDRATRPGYSEGLCGAANHTAPLPGGCEHQLKIHRGKQPLWLRLITFPGEEGNVRVSNKRLKTATAFARYAAAAGGTRGAPGGGIVGVGVTPAAAPAARPSMLAPREPDLEWDALQSPVLGCSRLLGVSAASRRHREVAGK